MIEGAGQSISTVGRGAMSTGLSSSTTGAPTSSFADTLDKSIQEVTRLQEDASQAVANLATGETQDVTGVMTAMEKSALAFKTLLAIRGKLMDAYDEVKNISI